MPEIDLKRIQHFFEHYKDLEPEKWVRVGNWRDPDEAHRLIRESIARAKPDVTPVAATRSPAGEPSCR